MSFNILVFTALLLTSSSAFDCVGGSCAEKEEDEVSFVQTKQAVHPRAAISDGEEKKQAVKQGEERAPNRTAKVERAPKVDARQHWTPVVAPVTPIIEPIVYWKAEADSKPAGVDDGEVSAAFGTNLELEKSSVTKKTSDQLDYHGKVYDQRMKQVEGTQQKVLADQREVNKALMRDNLAVTDAFNDRISTERKALEKMAKAKQDYEAHMIKKAQAEKAALEGRLEGQREGQEDSLRQRFESQEEEAKAAFEKQRTMEKQMLVKKAAEEQAALFSNRDAEAKLFSDDRAAFEQEFEKQRASSTSAEEAYLTSNGVASDSMIMHAADRYVHNMQTLLGDAERTTDAFTSAGYDFPTAAADGLGITGAGYPAYPGWA